VKVPIAIILIAYSYSVSAQGTFQNLDFESATLSPVPPNSGPPVYVPISSGLPGWTGYIGTVQQAQIIQNTFGLGQAEIDILGPNYPAAGPLPGTLPGTIDGNYSVLLQSGLSPIDGTSLVGASIAQTGAVPLGAESMQFKAWQTLYTKFTVSFDGLTLFPVVLGTGPNYTLYGVNISPYDGQTGPLEFTANFSGTVASRLSVHELGNPY
jgi:hypothetical protein